MKIKYITTALLALGLVTACESENHEPKAKLLAEAKVSEKRGERDLRLTKVPGSGTDQRK